MEKKYCKDCRYHEKDIQNISDYCTHTDTKDDIGDQQLCFILRSIFNPCYGGRLFEPIIPDPPKPPPAREINEDKIDPKPQFPPNEEIREDQIFPNKSERRWWQLFRR